MWWGYGGIKYENIYESRRVLGNKINNKRFRGIKE